MPEEQLQWSEDYMDIECHYFDEIFEQSYQESYLDKVFPAGEHSLPKNAFHYQLVNGN